MMNTSSSPLRPLPHIGFGVVHHARTRPSAHRFTYGTYFLMLPMHLEQAVDEGAAAAELQPNRPGALSFFDEDHGEGRSAAQGGAMPWLQTLLRSQGIGSMPSQPSSVLITPSCWYMNVQTTAITTAGITSGIILVQSAEAQNDPTKLVQTVNDELLPNDYDYTTASGTQTLVQGDRVRLGASYAGGGLAGSEAAWQAAEAGVPVVLHEMRPVRGTDAHHTDGLAELVCSNSFRSDDAQANEAYARSDNEVAKADILVAEAARAARDECDVTCEIEQFLYPCTHEGSHSSRVFAQIWLREATTRSQASIFGSS